MIWIKENFSISALNNGGFSEELNNAENVG